MLGELMEEICNFGLSYKKSQYFAKKEWFCSSTDIQGLENLLQNSPEQNDWKNVVLF